MWKYNMHDVSNFFRIVPNFNMMKTDTSFFRIRAHNQRVDYSGAYNYKF